MCFGNVTLSVFQQNIYQRLYGTFAFVSLNSILQCTLCHGNERSIVSWLNTAYEEAGRCSVAKGTRDELLILEKGRFFD